MLITTIKSNQKDNVLSKNFATLGYLKMSLLKNLSLNSFPKSSSHFLKVALLKAHEIAFLAFTLKLLEKIPSIG
jgi:uncharacterized membrane protein